MEKSNSMFSLFRSKWKYFVAYVPIVYNDKVPRFTSAKQLKRLEVNYKLNRLLPLSWSKLTNYVAYININYLQRYGTLIDKCCKELKEITVYQCVYLCFEQC